MKKYLATAAILAGIAAVSVSFLAQAETKEAAPAMVADAYMVDSKECMTGAGVAEGAMATEEQHAVYVKCMMDKKHTEEEMKAHETAPEKK